MSKLTLSEGAYQEHRALASHLEAIYIEIDKLAKKTPSERITPLIAKKINHIIVKVREQVRGDDFLDAIETLPVEDETVRLDETLVILGELRSVMDRQWNSPEFTIFRNEMGRQYDTQIIRAR